MSTSNIYKAILLGDNKHVTTLFKCGKCGSEEVRVREQQTRSSDEPLTIFVTCKKCGHVEVTNED